jgi:hypothetical protein
VVFGSRTQAQINSDAFFEFSLPAVRIMFTGMKQASKKYAKAVYNLGAIIVDDVDVCTHLIAERYGHLMLCRGARSHCPVALD